MDETREALKRGGGGRSYRHSEAPVHAGHLDVLGRTLRRYLWRYPYEPPNLSAALAVTGAARWGPRGSGQRTTRLGESGQFELGVTRGGSLTRRGVEG